MPTCDENYGELDFNKILSIDDGEVPLKRIKELGCFCANAAIEAFDNNQPKVEKLYRDLWMVCIELHARKYLDIEHPTGNA